MTTRRLNKTALLICFLACSSLLVQCGIDDERYFDEDSKGYGVTDANVQDNEAGAKVENPGGDGAEVDIDGEDYSTFTQDPSEIIFRSRYQGLVDRSELFLLSKDGDEIIETDPRDSDFYSDTDLLGYTVIGGYGPKIEKTAKTPINLIAEQTAGDDDAAIYRQHVEASFDEMDSGEKLFADNNESGTQIYDRHLTPGDCPESLVCINRAQNIPKKGDGQTYCYYDEEGDNIAVPVGISPGASYAVVKDLPTEYGPYTVRRYAVAGVDCNDSIRKKYIESTVIVSLGVTKSSVIMKKVNKDNLTKEKIDFGLTVYVQMLDKDGNPKPHNALPYLDARTGFQSATAYYFNDKSGRLLKIVKTLRKKFVGKPSYIYQGLKADVGFRFCKSLLAKNGKDFCKEAAK